MSGNATNEELDTTDATSHVDSLAELRPDQPARTCCIDRLSWHDLSAT